MNNHVRKIYLHFDHPGQNVDVRVGRLDERTVDRERGCTHYLHFTCKELYSRVWVNLKELKIRRDLLGIYLMDFRGTRMNDRVLCTREARDRVLRIRPNLDFCRWRQ